MNFHEILAFVANHAPTAPHTAVVFSVLFGEYDLPPRVVDTADLEYFLFTDRPELVGFPWRPIYVDPEKYGPQRTGRYLKCLGHKLFPMANISVYVDASFEFISPLKKLLLDYPGVRFGLFMHPNHNDIASEMEACIMQGKDDSHVLTHQVLRYRCDGLPEPSVCYATGVLIRDLTSPAVAAVNEMWCLEIAKASVRDQVSLPYVFWTKGFIPEVVKGNIFYNNYLVPRTHAKASILSKVKRWVAIRFFLIGTVCFGSKKIWRRR